MKFANQEFEGLPSDEFGAHSAAVRAVMPADHMQMLHLLAMCYAGCVVVLANISDKDALDGIKEAISEVRKWKALTETGARPQ